ncbi:hypothetical protein JOQ06_005719 [Pogonophryne albipinna]|uniref:Uncharacterized protein n=1 Tax=Pogonophryne albipinna TaxID=1090488 RepID=A0AAD6BFW3_9TELE|nr:hypothetical protein JOQ06_005719 [Pogonophryne albipinna]
MEKKKGEKLPVGNRKIQRYDVSGLSRMVLLQGAGSCPTHSMAYQPHIQLSMKEGWKDGEIIGQSGSERQQASKGQRLEGCSDKEG